MISETILRGVRVHERPPNEARSAGYGVATQMATWHPPSPRTAAREPQSSKARGLLGGSSFTEGGVPLVRPKTRVVFMGVERKAALPTVAALPQLRSAAPRARGPPAKP